MITLEPPERTPITELYDLLAKFPIPEDLDSDAWSLRFTSEVDSDGEAMYCIHFYPPWFEFGPAVSSDTADGAVALAVRMLQRYLDDPVWLEERMEAPEDHVLRNRLYNRYGSWVRVP